MENFSPDISREEDKSHKGFKENPVKNTWNKVVTALEFIQSRNYFYFNFFASFFETILFIWLNPLVPGVSNLHIKYHYLILSV